jgi:hypothetical protein
MSDKTPPIETSPPKKRKKSQNRQRTERMSAALTKTEFNQAAAKIKAAGYTRGGFIRAALLGSDGPASLHALPVHTDLIREFLAACGRHGNNWNQIAYKLNAGAAPYKLQEDVERELAHLRELIAIGLEALGKNPHRA